MERTSSTDSWGQILTPEWRNTDLLVLRGRRRAGAKPEPSSSGTSVSLRRSTAGSGWTSAGRLLSWLPSSKQESDQQAKRIRNNCQIRPIDPSPPGGASGDWGGQSLTTRPHPAWRFPPFRSTAMDGEPRENPPYTWRRCTQKRPEPGTPDHFALI